MFHVIGNDATIKEFVNNINKFENVLDTGLDNNNIFSKQGMSHLRTAPSLFLACFNATKPSPIVRPGMNTRLALLLSFLFRKQKQ